MQTKRNPVRALCMLLALMLCATMAACSGGSTSTNDTPAAQPDTTDADTAPDAATDDPAPADAAAGDPASYSGEIVFWSWSETETNGLAEKFNAVYPNVKIKYVPVDSASYLTKFQTTMVSSGELPDVALQEVGVRGALFEMDCWENLEADPYNFDRSLVYPQILPLMTNNRDEVIGIERELNPSGLYYKRDLAKQYLGTDDPDEVGELLSDWDKFIDAGAKVAQDSSGAVKLVSGLSDMENILYSQYTDVVFEENLAHATTFFEHNLDLMVRMRDANMAGKLQRSSPAWNSSHLDEEHMIYSCAPWSAQWILKPSDPDSEGRWAVTTAPGGGYSNGGTAYGIPRDAKNKDLAWQFIYWSTCTDEGVQGCVDVVGAIVSKEAFNANGLPANPDPYFGGQDTNAYLMERAAPTMKIRPLSQYDVVLNDVFKLVTDMITNDPSMTKEAAVEYAVTEMTNKLPATMTVE